MAAEKSQAYGGFLSPEGQLPRSSTAAGWWRSGESQPSVQHNHGHAGEGHLERGDQQVANNDQRRTHSKRPACRRPGPLAMSAFSTVTLMLTGCLARGWGGGGMLGDGNGGTAGMTGYGINAAGPGQMGMGYSDPQFIWMMIPHHEGAIAMADLALNRAKRTEIKELAKSIKASQTRENAQMRTWYQQWYGKAVPSWGPGTGWGWQGGMGMGMGSAIFSSQLALLFHACDVFLNPCCAFSAFCIGFSHFRWIS